jgi:hypothetical protein
MPGFQDPFPGDPQRAWQRRANPVRIALLHLALESRIADVMQAIANTDIEINEVRPQCGKLSSGKVREKLVLIRYRLWHFCSRLAPISVTA